MSERDDAVRRGHAPSTLHTGEGKVLVPLSADQLAELIDNTLRITTRDLLLRALALIDPERARKLDDHE